MGSIESEKAEAMLDAAEIILRDEGYAALTSRRVAEQTGVKQRLVYYYFQTMDDLVLAAFKRLVQRDKQRLEGVLKSDKPLHEIWSICMNTADARLIAEFMALANHHEGLRELVIDYIEESRKVQVRALKKALQANGMDTSRYSPDAIAFIGSSIALALNRESALGIGKGHRSVNKLVKEFFATLEP